MHNNQIVGKLKNRRLELGVTQEYLAEIAGISLRTLKKIEAGNSNPTLETLTKLASVLGMELKIEVARKGSSI